MSHQHSQPIDEVPVNDLDKTRITLGVALGALLVILAGVAGGVWWAASISGKIDSLTTAVTSAASDHYGAKDAARDGRDRDRINADLQRQLDDMKQRLTALELKKGPS